MSYLIKNDIQNLFVSSTNTSTQAISTSQITLNGSEVYYTPHPQSNKVIYEYNFSFSWVPDSANLIQIEIEQESSGVYSSLGSEWRRIAPGHYTNNGATNCSLMYILDPWQGKKGIRLRVNSYSSSFEATAHITRVYHQAQVNKAVFPTLKIYSIIGEQL